MSSVIQDLIAKKNYPKAIDAINAELKKRSRDARLRMQLADTLILANRNREAIPCGLRVSTTTPFRLQLAILYGPVAGSGSRA